MGNEAAAQDVEAAMDTTGYAWVAVLLAYAFVASVLPVWLLFATARLYQQFQLYFALSTMLIGLIIAAVVGARRTIRCRAVPLQVPGAVGLPFLFVTNRLRGGQRVPLSGLQRDDCPADQPRDRRLADWLRAMLVEGALAILVIMACVAGLGSGLAKRRGVFQLERIGKPGWRPN